MTKLGNCVQKTYYKAATNVQSVRTDVSITVYPNPASTQLNVEINATTQAPTDVTICNMMGQKIITVTATNNKAAIDVSMLPAGPYVITCYSEGSNISSVRFIKN
jgi:hypothetical protein